MDPELRDVITRIAKSKTPLRHRVLKICAFRTSAKLQVHIPIMDHDESILAGTISNISGFFPTRPPVIDDAQIQMLQLSQCSSEIVEVQDGNKIYVKASPVPRYISAYFAFCIGLSFVAAASLCLNKANAVEYGVLRALAFGYVALPVYFAILTLLVSFSLFTNRPIDRKLYSPFIHCIDALIVICAAFVSSFAVLLCSALTTIHWRADTAEYSYIYPTVVDYLFWTLSILYPTGVFALFYSLLIETRCQVLRFIGNILWITVVVCIVGFICVFLFAIFEYEQYITSYSCEFNFMIAYIDLIIVICSGVLDIAAR